MQFTPFHPLFQHASIFVSLEITPVGGPLFATTVVADKPEELMAAIRRGLFDDALIAEQETLVLSHIASSLSDETIWINNALTNGPMRAKCAYSDDEAEVLVTVYLVTDSTTVPDVNREVIEIEGADMSSVAGGVLTTVGTMIGAARQNDGVAFIGYVEREMVLSILAFMASTTKHFAFCQMVASGTPNEEFVYVSDNDTTSVAIEAAFASDLFADFGQEIMDDDKVFIAAADGGGSTYVQLYGAKNAVFRAIQKGAHALISIRPLKPPHE